MALGAVLLGFVWLIEQSIWAHDGPSPQPSIWAVPGAVVSEGSTVTIFCRTPPGVTTVRLHHYVPMGKWYDCTPQGSQEVFEFILQNVIQTHAGIYYCEYCKGSEWSQISDKLELMVLGVYEDKPSLTVDSGPQGLSERNVTLLCHPPHFFDTFILCRDGNASFPQNCSHQNHKTFVISPVSPGHRRTYRCFGSFKENSYLCSRPSDPLKLPILEPSSQPSIWAVPGAVISKGSNVTIFCRTPPGVTEVRLTKYNKNNWYKHIPQGAQEVFEFSLQNMIHTNAGVYYCDYFEGGEWARISDNLELVVTGVYEDKPSLTVDSGPQGLSERNVTLLCHPPYSFDTFILCRDGNASFPQNCSHQDHKTFVISPVSPGHRRTYRCFGSFKQNSYLWSQPSDPLELPIPDPSGRIVVWASVAAVCFLLILLLFICLCCHWAKCRTTSGETRRKVKYRSSSPTTDIDEKNKCKVE